MEDLFWMVTSCHLVIQQQCNRTSSHLAVIRNPHGWLISSQTSRQIQVPLADSFAKFSLEIEANLKV